jgi:hypothetical protein
MAKEIAAVHQITETEAVKLIEQSLAKALRSNESTKAEASAPDGSKGETAA